MPHQRLSWQPICRRPPGKARHLKNCKNVSQQRQILSPEHQGIRTKYKEKSQIIQKLNFLNEETVVMWSELGYMLIKPVSTRIPFDPFKELTAEKKERFTAFLKQWFSEHRK